MGVGWQNGAPGRRLARRGTGSRAPTRLERNPEFRERIGGVRTVSCTTSLLGRTTPNSVADKAPPPTQRPCLGEIPVCQDLLNLAEPQVSALAEASFSPKAGYCAGQSLPRRVVAQKRPAFRPQEGASLPSRDKVARSLAQRPGLGENPSFENESERICAQRPCSGETRGHARLPAALLTGAGGDKVEKRRPDRAVEIGL